jgi:hypothetical protein
MASNRGFFEPCWTPIYPDDQGDRDDVTRVIESPTGTGIIGPDRHPLSQRFHDILADVAAMHDMKQADYGRDDDPFYNIRQTENWGPSAWVGAMIRADDKMGRLRNLSKHGGSLKNEPIEDSLLDIAVYAVIALVLREEESARLAQAEAVSSV